jgi:hypothetical protein
MVAILFEQFTDDDRRQNGQRAFIMIAATPG